MHPQPPTFCGFHPSESPKGTPRHPYTGGHLVQPEGSPAQPSLFLARFEPVVACFGPWKIPKCLENGPFQDQKWVKNGPFGILKQVFLAHFEPVVTRFGQWKIPKGLENGPFWDQKWVENGPQTRFAKSDPAPFGMLIQAFLAHFEPLGTGFGPWKIPKCLEKGPFWEQKWVKNWSKTRFSNTDPGQMGVHEQVF